MSAIYLAADGFDDYTTPTDLWTIPSGSSLFTIGSGGARFAPPSGLPGAGLIFTGNVSPFIGVAYRNFWQNQTPQDVVIGAALQLQTLPGTGFTSALFGT